MNVLPRTLILSPLFCFSKKRLFEEIAACAATELPSSADDIVAALNSRETAGSTVFFDGIALPHAATAAPETLGVFCILDRAVPFNAIDAEPQSVDLAYCLFIAASADYDATQQLTARICTALSNQDLLNALRLNRNEPDKISWILEQLDLLMSADRSAPGS